MTTVLGRNPCVTTASTPAATPTRAMTPRMMPTTASGLTSRLTSSASQSPVSSAGSVPAVPAVSAPADVASAGPAGTLSSSAGSACGGTTSAGIGRGRGSLLFSLFSRLDRRCSARLRLAVRASASPASAVSVSGCLGSATSPPRPARPSPVRQEAPRLPPSAQPSALHHAQCPPRPAPLCRRSGRTAHDQDHEVRLARLLPMYLITTHRAKSRPGCRLASSQVTPRRCGAPDPAAAVT